MRTVTLVVAVAAVCVTSAAALAQARILTVQQGEQAPPPAQQRAAPPPHAPAQVDEQSKSAQQDQVQAPDRGAGGAAGETASTPASATKRQDRVPPAAERYRFTPVDNGFLRLDRKSGNVTYCTSHTAGWSCAAVAENRPSLERQIAQLRDEVAALKQEIAALRAPPAAPAPPPPASASPPAQSEQHPVPPQTVPPGKAPSAPPPPDRQGGATLKLPSHQDLARARGFITDTWHRLVEMIQTMQKDLLHTKDDGDAKQLSKQVSRT